MKDGKGDNKFVITTAPQKLICGFTLSFSSGYGWMKRELIMKGKLQLQKRRLRRRRPRRR
jgi:hypothetical protein